MKPAFKLLSVLILFFGAMYAVPLSEVEQLLTVNFFSTESEVVTPAPVAAIQEVEIAPVQSFSDGEYEFVLEANRLGTANYTIPQNTCRNGVRVVARSTLTVSGMSADLHVFGFSRRSSRETYNNVLSLTKENPVKIVHLPSELLYNNDTLFPEYQINKSKNADSLRYDVMCY
jgi:hypothetical protein